MAFGDTVRKHPAYQEYKARRELMGVNEDETKDFRRMEDISNGDYSEKTTVVGQYPYTSYNTKSSYNSPKLGTDYTIRNYGTSNFNNGKAGEVNLHVSSNSPTGSRMRVKNAEVTDPSNPYLRFSARNDFDRPLGRIYGTYGDK